MPETDEANALRKLARQLRPRTRALAELSTFMLEFTDRVAAAAEQAYVDEPDLFEAVLSDRTPENFHHATWLPEAYSQGQSGHLRQVTQIHTL
jgi:hypothetical protein